MKQVLIPHRNLVDVENDLPEHVRKDMEIVGVHTVGEVLARIFPDTNAWPQAKM